MTTVQLRYALEHMPLVEARRHYPMARLQADLREFMMPRYLEPDPEEERNAKPPRARDPWDALELLPFYASFGEEPPITPVQAESLTAAFDRLPAWVRAVAPIEAARSALGAAVEAGQDAS